VGGLCTPLSSLYRCWLEKTGHSSAAMADPSQVAFSMAGRQVRLLLDHHGRDCRPAMGSDGPLVIGVSWGTGQLRTEYAGASAAVTCGDRCTVRASDHAVYLSVQSGYPEVPEALGAVYRNGSVVVCLADEAPCQEWYLAKHAVEMVLVMAANCGLWGDTAVVHASCGASANGGLLFTGPSGVGKSTIKTLFASHGAPVGDEPVAVRVAGNRALAYGTLSRSAYHWPCGGEALPLAGVHWLRHGDQNAASRLRPGEALRGLVGQIYHPRRLDLMWSGRSLMEFVLDLVGAVPVYELRFRPTEEVVPFLEGLHGGSAD